MKDVAEKWMFSFFVTCFWVSQVLCKVFELGEPEHDPY